MILSFVGVCLILLIKIRGYKVPLGKIHSHAVRRSLSEIINEKENNSMNLIKDELNYYIVDEKYMTNMSHSDRYINDRLHSIMGNRSYIETPIIMWQDMHRNLSAESNISAEIITNSINQSSSTSKTISSENLFLSNNYTPMPLNKTDVLSSSYPSHNFSNIKESANIDRNILNGTMFEICAQERKNNSYSNNNNETVKIYAQDEEETRYDSLTGVEKVESPLHNKSETSSTKWNEQIPAQNSEVVDQQRNTVHVQEDNGNVNNLDMAIERQDVRENVKELYKKSKLEKDEFFKGKVNIDNALLPSSVSVPSLEDLSSSEKEIVISTGLLLLIMMLALSLICVNIFKRFKVFWLQMPICATTMGLVVGALLKYVVNAKKSILVNILALNEDVFFVMFLPPIIFEGGMSMTEDEVGCYFFKNFGAILSFAFLCTTISFCFIGASMFFAGYLDLSTNLSIRESFAFGALISSTDPVAVIAMFKQMKADPTIYALVFGESLLNDAISIVLYRTIAQEAAASVGTVILKFCLCFFASLCIGIAVGLLSAVIYKYMDLIKEEDEVLESALFLLFPWIAYLVADGLNYSGIVSICFCGITMGHYTFFNLSSVAQMTSKSVFSALALLAETVVFIFLGLAVFSFEHDSNRGIYVISLIVVTIARFVSVYVTAGALNIFRHENKISNNFQLALILCGLRGAIAFALSERARHDFGGTSGRALLSATLFYSLFTVLCVGVTLAFILRKLGVFKNEDGEQICNANKIQKDRMEKRHNYAYSLLSSRAGENSTITVFDAISAGCCGKMKKLLLTLDETIMKPIFSYSSSNARERHTQQMTRLGIKIKDSSNLVCSNPYCMKTTSSFGSEIDRSSQESVVMNLNDEVDFRTTYRCGSDYSSLIPFNLEVYDNGSIERKSHFIVKNDDDNHVCNYKLSDFPQKTVLVECPIYNKSGCQSFTMSSNPFGAEKSLQYSVVGTLDSSYHNHNNCTNLPQVAAVYFPRSSSLSSESTSFCLSSSTSMA